MSYDEPTHTFFMTAGNKVVKQTQNKQRNNCAQPQQQPLNPAINTHTHLSHFTLHILTSFHFTSHLFTHTHFSFTFFFSFLSTQRREEDITLFTAIRPTGLEWLVGVAEAWGGPISAAIYISDTNQDIPRILNRWLNNKAMRDNVDVHFTFDVKYAEAKREGKAYPINYLKSVALRNTRTEIVMYLDEGHTVPKTLRATLKKDL